MSFTYNLNIPAANNNPSADQPNMKTNTNSIDSIINVDHFKFSAGNAGRHKQVTLTNQAAPGFIGGNGVFFANLANGNSWPFWQNASGTFPLFGQNSIASSGYTTLPGGIILQWGSDTFSAGNSHINGSSTFASIGNIAFPNNCFSVVGTLSSNDGSDTTASNTFAITSFSKTKINWVFNTSKSGGSSTYNGYYFFAIGN